MDDSEFKRSVIETQLTEKSIAIAYDIIVAGMTLKKVVKKHGTSEEHIEQSVATVESAWSKLQHEEGLKSVVFEDDETFTVVYGQAENDRHE